MERKSVREDAGLTQAESVKELVTSSEFESATVTLSSIPSKYNAPPIFPTAQIGPLVNVPMFPFPEESQAVLPLRSSNVQYPTRPDAVPVGVVVGVGVTVDVDPSVRPLGATGGGVKHCEEASDRKATIKK